MHVKCYSEVADGSNESFTDYLLQVGLFSQLVQLSQHSTDEEVVVLYSLFFLLSFLFLQRIATLLLNSLNGAIRLRSVHLEFHKRQVTDRLIEFIVV